MIKRWSSMALAGMSEEMRLKSYKWNLEASGVNFTEGVGGHFYHYMDQPAGPFRSLSEAVMDAVANLVEPYFKNDPARQEGLTTRLDAIEAKIDLLIELVRNIE